MNKSWERRKLLISKTPWGCLTSTKHSSGESLSYFQEVKTWTFCLQCNAVSKFRGLQFTVEFKLHQNVAWLSPASLVPRGGGSDNINRNGVSAGV